MLIRIHVLLAVMLSIVSGCATTSVYDTRYGSFKVISNRTSTVLAAPHGTYDVNTGSITDNVCNKLRFSCVIATGFVPKGTRINVNRPTEGVGKRSSKEPGSDRAIESYKEFKGYVSSVAEPNLDLYIEIHGSAIKGVEVALENITLVEARRIKTILEEEWYKHSPSPILIKVQGIDKIRKTGGGVKKYGIVAEIQPRYIQFEFSRKLRDNEELLSRFLVSSIRRISIEL